jgi:cytochrome b6-f complex iron-sulfur subunit
MKSSHLPITDRAGCAACSRRTLLGGLGIAAVGALLLDVGCQQQGSSLATATTSTCGTGHCIDLGDAANQDLGTVGGAMLIESARDTIMVIRASDTEVLALSAVCTHAGCTMDYNAAQRVLDCGCHGSQFSTTGTVLRGPANRAVRVYTTTLANNTITIDG